MVDGEGASRALDLGVRSGSLDDLHGQTVAIAAKRAETAHVAVGDRVNFALGDGNVRFISSNVDSDLFRRLGHRKDGALTGPF